MRGTRWLLVAGLAALAAVALACGSDGEQPTRLVVIDQNVLHGIINEDPDAEPFDRFPERLPLTAGALAEAQPDVILLQEVLIVGEQGYPDVRATLRDTVGGQYTQVFGSIGDEPINEGALGQMTLTRLPVVSKENYHIGGVRTAVRTTVQTERGPLDIYNVHLDGTDEDNPQASIDEIAKVLQFIRDTRSGGPIILAGDFNAKPQDPSILALVADGFVDALATAGDATCAQQGDPGCTNSTVPLGDNPEDKADQRIDYIFVKEGDEVSVDVTEASLFNDEPVDIGDGHTLWPSDHIGVRAVLELRAN